MCNFGKFSKNLLNSIIIFMSYSLIMAIIWILLESPDLAITEAAVGAGITSVLFFVTLKKIQAIVAVDGDNNKETTKIKNNAQRLKNSTTIQLKSRRRTRGIFVRGFANENFSQKKSVKETLL